MIIHQRQHCKKNLILPIETKSGLSAEGIYLALMREREVEGQIGRSEERVVPALPD